MRRLVICCDGTWQTALFQPDLARLTNISRLHNAITRQDGRHSPPIEQVKLYMPGPGTGQELVLGVASGALGDGVVSRIREAYYWLCQNYEPGDEIHLYGFSRGAYLARLVASLVCRIGLLDPLSTLTLLPQIFTLLCSKRSLETKSGRRLQNELDELLDSDAVKLRRQAQIRAQSGGFLVQVLGVFEIVPTFHLHTLSHEHDLLPIASHNPFFLSDSDLEPEIAKAVQGLAISEARPSYVPVILRRGGSVHGQELLQVWLPGCHSDVGGGQAEHDLADVALNWLVAQVETDLALNLSYISQLSQHAVAPWGAHRAQFGLASSLHHTPRHLPHGIDTSTYQRLHPSLLAQNALDLPKDIRPLVLEASDHPLFVPLTPFEQRRKETWPVSSRRDSAAPEPGRVSAPSPAPDSPRLLANPRPTAFHAGVRPRGKNVAVGLSRLRQGYRAAVSAERGFVEDVKQLHAKLAGSGDLPRDSRGR
ncbi:hypothetical protein JCM11491_004116 [Sporobolomyces phaffii]